MHTCSGSEHCMCRACVQHSRVTQSAPVRTRPMPWAPFLRAMAASAGVSALVNTPICRRSGSRAGGAVGGQQQLTNARAKKCSCAATSCMLLFTQCMPRKHAWPPQAACQGRLACRRAKEAVKRLACLTLRNESTHSMNTASLPAGRQCSTTCFSALAPTCC